MDPQQLLDALAKHGVDVTALESVPPAALEEMLRVLDAANSDAPPPVEGEAPDEGGALAKMMAQDEMEEPLDEEQKAAYRECARRYNERVKKFGERHAMHMARAKKYMERYGEETERDPERPDRPEDEKMTPEKMSEMIREALAVELAKVKGEITKFSEIETAGRKVSAIDAFLDAELLAGRVLPREMDRTDPGNLPDRLKRADAKKQVYKFSEGGKQVALTELDLQMREIRNRPAFSFAERVKAGPVNVSAEDAEVEKIATHFAENEAGFARHNLTKEALVSAFRAERKDNPELTASQFLNKA